MKQVFIILFCLLTITSCNYKHEFKSPNSNYQIIVDDENQFKFTLIDSVGKELNHFKFHGSGFHKWSANWYNDKIFILHSHDIGTYGWKIENNQFEEIELTYKMNESSFKSFENKYQVKDRCRKHIK